MLSAIVRRVAGASTRHPKTVVAMWVTFVCACLASGAFCAVHSLSDADGDVGSSARAERQLARAGLHDPAAESILVHGQSALAADAAGSALVSRLARSRDVASATVAARAQAGRAVLVRATLPGDDADDDHAKAIARLVADVRRAHPGAQFAQTGPGSFDIAVTDVVTSDLGRAEKISIPLTLLILVVAFGALVAAVVPVLLGLTSVAAAVGLLGVVSQITPVSDPTATLVVLIGLAVGVDYSLFYIRREREERAAGLGADAALAASAATAGRAIAVSGLTVMVALAGLLATQMAVFASMALATMLVVAIAVVGSLTVLPATLALLGDRIDRGRLPLLGRRHHGRSRLWTRAGAIVTRRPRAALLVALCALGLLAAPAAHMHTTGLGADDLPAGTAVVKAQRDVARQFGSSPEDAVIVVRGRQLSAQADALRAFGTQARRALGVDGPVGVRVARDGRTASVSVPMPGNRTSAALATLRRDVLPQAAGVVPGASVRMAGDEATTHDFTARLRARTPLVVGAVLLVAFALLVGAFGSTRLALSVIGLNLLSVAAGYGVMTAVFQGRWAEHLLGFTSSGSIANYLPLMCFVVLFGLSMDYTVLVLERIREARLRGVEPRAAAAEGIAASGSTVTSAAVVMVAVFAVFATLRLLELKQLGVGLSAAILVDATLVRGLALPAVVALLGERGWSVRRGARPARRPRPARLASTGS